MNTLQIEYKEKLDDYEYDAYRCRWCNHVWIPRTPKPKFCPRCESKYIERIRVRRIEVIV